MEDYGQDISKLTNNELKENIINLNKSKLKGIKESSYLNAFNAILTLKFILEDNTELNLLKNISEKDIFKQYTQRAIKLINHSVDEGENKSFLSEALEIRKDLYDLAKITEGYFIELSYIEQIINQYEIKLKSKTSNKKDLREISIEKIIVSIQQRLELSKEDYRSYNYIISEIVYSLPMRLTKDKYFNIIKDSLIRNLSNISKSKVEDKINYYKRQWDSSLQYGYGINFDYYFIQIEKFKKISFNEKTMDELNKIVEELAKITNELNELYNFILILGLTYNMIISIYLSIEAPISIELEEFLKEWNKVIENNDKDLIDNFLSKSNEKIEKSEKETFQYVSEFEELNKEAIERKKFEDKELVDMFLYTKDILVYYNDYNLSNIDLLFTKDDEITSDFYLEQLIDSLIKYISRSMSKMSNIERRSRMRKLLSLIDLPFKNIKEFRGYIIYALDRKNTSQEEIRFITDSILYFLNNIEQNK